LLIKSFLNAGGFGFLTGECYSWRLPQWRSGLSPYSREGRLVWRKSPSRV